MAADFARYLGPREIIRWTGQPQQGLALRAADALLIPFGLLWCGFAVFWELGVWSSGAPSFLMLWGGAFVCAGLYIVFGRFFADAYLRSKVQYALTDQRALILGGLTGNDLTAIDLRTTSEIRYKDIDGSCGTISFGPDPGPFRRGGIWHSTNRSVPEFFRTPDAAGAYKLIQAAKNASSPNV
jgi:membrane protein implicated in regulation of membrane protease activity